MKNYFNEDMARKWFMSAIATLFVFIPLTAVKGDEISSAKEQLTRQMTLCDQIDNTLDSLDRGRLRTLKQASEATLQSINAVGLGNMATMNLYQMQIISYDYSGRYFNSVQSELNSDDIAELQSIAAKIKQDRGGQFLKITNYVFTNLEKHFRSLRGELADGDGLAVKLDDQNLNFWAELLNVIARSMGGDRPGESNCGAIKLYFKIKTLYPEFERISQSSPLYDMSLSIIGLTEFYAEYANPENARCGL